MPTPVTEKNFASRNRRQKSDFRKRQLIEATMDCIDGRGLSQTTLASIAARAGLSQGNVLFHFQSKDALLEQTLRFLSDEFIANWQLALAQAPQDPAAQIRALIKAPFAARVCSRKKISVWYAFLGETRSRPKYMQVCGANDRAYSARLLALCEAFTQLHGGRLLPQTAALSLEGMIDGLWQNFLIGPVGFKRAHAIQVAFELLESIFPAIASKSETDHGFKDEKRVLSRNEKSNF